MSITWWWRSRRGGRRSWNGETQTHSIFVLLELKCKHIMKTLIWSPLLLRLKKQHTVCTAYHIFPIDENCFYIHITFVLHHFRFFSVENLLFLFSRFPPVERIPFFYLCCAISFFRFFFLFRGEVHKEGRKIEERFHCFYYYIS